ncbi:MAG: insulinase family protein, partial [Verrucomicrobiia bacterium]
DLHLESPYNFMTWIGESLLGYGRVIHPEETRTQIRAVTGEDVRRIARECLEPGRRAFGLCGPHPNLEKLARLL